MNNRQRSSAKHGDWRNGNEIILAGMNEQLQVLCCLRVNEILEEFNLRTNFESFSSLSSIDNFDNLFKWRVHPYTFYEQKD